MYNRYNGVFITLNTQDKGKSYGLKFKKRKENAKARIQEGAQEGYKTVEVFKYTQRYFSSYYDNCDGICRNVR